MEYIFPAIAFTVMYFVIGFIGAMIGEGPWGYDDKYEPIGVIILWPLHLIKCFLMLLILLFKISSF